MIVLRYTVILLASLSLLSGQEKSIPSDDIELVKRIREMVAEKVMDFMWNTSSPHFLGK